MEYLSDDEIYIAHRSNDFWNVSNLQIHDYYEINIALMDARKFFLEGQVYPLKRGTLFKINNTLLHRNVSAGMRYHRCVIKFMPILMQKFCTAQTNLLACFHTAPPILQLDENQISYIMNLVGQIEALKCGNEFGCDIHQQILFAQILLYLNRLSPKDCIQPETYPLDSKVSLILQYINSHISEELSLQKIASQFYISRSKLCGMFKTTLGSTVNDYILHRRILKAKQLMNSSYSLLEISVHCGFNSYTHFARCFKSITVYTSKEYLIKNS